MAGSFDLVIRAGRAIVGAAEQPCTIGVTAGRIAAVGPGGEAAAAPVVLELDDDVVLLPGLVDSHVHVCEPGHTEWEGFATATRAAAAGGITTIVDMPLDSVPVTVSIAALEVKRRAARGQCRVDVGFWGGVIPGNLAELGPLHQAGVLGFKCFLADSGAADFPPVDSHELTAALGVVRSLGAPLLVHAESAEAAAAIPEAGGRSYAGYLASRPRGLENLAIAQAPCTPEMKALDSGDFASAWGGIASLQLGPGSAVRARPGGRPRCRPDHRERGDGRRE